MVRFSMEVRIEEERESNEDGRKAEGYVILANMDL
jgi:hypothetical protein